MRKTESQTVIHSHISRPYRVERRFCGERRPHELIRDLMSAHSQS